MPPETQIDDFPHFLQAVNVIYKSAPGFVSPDPPLVEDESTNSEPIGVPLYILFDLLINTGAGYSLFATPEFNKATEDLLDNWGKFLKSDKSTDTLIPTGNGWFTTAGLALLQSRGRNPFDGLYNCKPKEPHYGFTSWDDFFTRTFQDGKRPLGSNDPSALLSACESTVYRIYLNAKHDDRFWLKGEPYSLHDIFSTSLPGAEVLQKDYATLFTGGTVYQAFLGPEDYHHWHSPISGTVEAAVVFPGTYYSAIPDKGDPDVPDVYAGALIRSQSYLTAVAARAVIIIQSDNEKLGNPLVAFIGVGMCEVSTCDITPIQDKIGQQINAGDEIGLFHFGGSSHAVIVDPKVEVDFLPEIQDAVDSTGYAPAGKSTFVYVRSLLGYLKPAAPSHD